MERQYNVIIVGAGVAGLSAARLLGRFGLSCCVLEAAQLIGGRLRTLRRPGWQLPIELGAEFVHGRPGPTLALDSGAIELVPVPEHRAWIDSKAHPMLDTWPSFARALAAADRDQESVADYLARVEMPLKERELVRAIVEGYHAAPLTDVSAGVVADDARLVARDFRQYRTGGGYDQVLSSFERTLEQDCHIELGARVRQVSWRRGRVAIEGRGHQGPFSVEAEHAIVTVSVGVLKAAAILFDPLPSSFERALSGIGMGQVMRVVLRVTEEAPWVEPLGGTETTFAHVPSAAFPTLWRESRAGQTQVIAWAGGPSATRLSQLDEAERVRAACASLALATQTDVEACHATVIEAHCHDFNRDPLVCGAYSYVRPGGEESARTLATPWEDTLFFAGEALDHQYPSTVAGALGSGEHTARRVLESRSRNR